jgi:integrase
MADKRRIILGLQRIGARGLEAKSPVNWTNRGGQGRDRTGDLPLFRRTLVPTELPGRKASVCLAVVATLTGLEPATSAVTGRRANQLRHRALLCDPIVASVACTPYGIRTRATALKGRRPRPLDEGGQPNLSGVLAAR